MADIAYYTRPATQQEQELTAYNLRAHTEQAIGVPVVYEPFAVLAYNKQKLIGSVVGKTFLNWLHIDLVWVHDDYRGKGVGRELMDKAAKEAAKLGLNGIEVWTQSWQAPEFYLAIGYNIFAEFDDFIPGRKRHAFRKLLK